ncbi:MAG: hypothetical protein PHT41_07320, partial [Candidatus Omnitrophica bacterium]|nr:hypothetical protein [Candidatus Omnitrophota bacterium]
NCYYFALLPQIAGNKFYERSFAGSPQDYITHADNLAIQTIRFKRRKENQGLHYQAVEKRKQE